MTAQVLPATFTDPPAQRPRRHWRDQAACREGDLNVFFPLGEDKQTSPTHGEAAKKICSTCPVRPACLDWAMTQPEIYGIWGGTTAAERRTWRRHPSPTLSLVTNPERS